VDGNLKARIGTAVVGLPLLAWLVGWGAPWLLSIVFFLLTVAALREYFAMICPGDPGQQAWGILFGSAIGLTVMVVPASSIALWLSAFLIILFASALWSAGSLADRLNRLGWTLLGGFYIGFLVPQLALLFELNEGRAWVAFVILVVMAGDTSAYFIGRRFGTRKLAPDLSPGKTVEGSIAYVIGSIVIGLLAAVLLGLPVALFEVVMLALVMSLLGQIGDLFESLIKRAFVVKDSGELLPGHGGVLDRLDSLIFPVVFAKIYLKVMHS
jgi:phosphatidate cytidylyltransferase